MALNQMSSPDWSVRCDALRALGEFNDDRARAALEDALYDRDDTAVSQAAVDVMVKTDDERFLEPLVQAMTGGRPEMSDEDTSDVAMHVYFFLMDHAGTRLATEALRRADETGPPRRVKAVAPEETQGTFPDAGPGGGLRS